MRIHKITPSVDYNKWLKGLDTQLIEPTNQDSVKDSKVVETTNKTYFGNQCNKQPNIPSLPDFIVNKLRGKIISNEQLNNEFRKLIIIFK